MVPGRGETCLPAEPPRPSDFSAHGKVAVNDQCDIRGSEFSGEEQSVPDHRFLEIMI
jgi:hypothetical protein